MTKRRQRPAELNQCSSSSSIEASPTRRRRTSRDIQRLTREIERGGTPTELDTSVCQDTHLRLLAEMIIKKRGDRAEYFRALPIICNVAAIVRSYAPLLQGVNSFEVPTQSCLMNLSVHPVTNDLYIVDETRIFVREHGTGKTRVLCGKDQHGSRDGPADMAMFNWIGDLCFDREGSLYCTDFRNCQIRKVELPTGHVTTIAGNQFGTTDGPGNVARFRCPAGITVGPNKDTLFVTDEFSIRQLRQVDGTWHVTTLLTLDEDPGPLEYHRGRESIFVTSSSSVFEIPLATLEVKKVAEDLRGFMALALDPQSGTFLMNGNSTLSRLACHSKTGTGKDEIWSLLDEEITETNWPLVSQAIAYDKQHHRLYATYTTKNVIMMDIF